mgnify:CR=1 FL=1
MSDLAELESMMKKRQREKLRCACDVSYGAMAYDGLGCFKGKVTREVTIIYNDGCYGKETHNVCEACYKRLVHCVRRDGYKLTSKKI